ncbi:MAG: glycosyltransferase [Candidatus Margulisbacteria bacterium]|nr:glycosyltransferase [Candidatus Margulisiibacteriota bacterium]MBU1021964.1 glycosyltransferase [Candidatus Margulisiibacteriota bacterium]MBU1728943.1 glycosyltransferase [Candidatus Margulisiibacteriota bacterium]MBU1954749.1 glycosyltransferase [Candidatus Margulisiibacteriota bacterium]
MKIAIFADSYLPYISGVTVSVHTLLEDLQKLGHQVLLFAPDYPGAKKEKRVFRFPSIPSPYPAFRITIPYSLGFINRFNNFAPDIIHSHSPFQLGHRSQKLAGEQKIPYVYTLHTLFEKYAHHVPFIKPHHVSTRIRHHLEKFCSACQHIITPSPQTNDYLKELGVQTPSSVVKTGINLDAARRFSGKGIRKKYSIPEDATLLVYAGRLAKEKNIPFLFRVLKKIVAQENNVYLILVASGPEEDSLVKLAVSLGILGKVIFTGGAPHPLVFDYYAAGDIFVFSSKTETQGLVVAEAKIKGLPAVVIDAAGVSASVKDGEDGFLVPEDKNLFIEKVLLLIKNQELRKKMGEAAQFNGEKDFSSLHSTQKLEGIYASLIKK